MNPKHVYKLIDSPLPETVKLQEKQRLGSTTHPPHPETNLTSRLPGLTLDAVTHQANPYAAPAV